MTRQLCLILGSIVGVFVFQNWASADQERRLYRSIEIVAGPEIDAVEQRYVDLLRGRLEKLVEIASEARDAEDHLTVYLGTLQSHRRLRSLADSLGVAFPTELDPGPEGFVLATGEVDERPAALLIGSDRRGILYAIGEFLRRVEQHGQQLSVPRDVELRRAPRWPVRGLLVVQGHTMRELTGARAWTLPEWQQAHLDYALAGANTFEVPPHADWKPIYDMLRGYGLRTHTIISGNAGSGPPEWQAKEAIGRTGYLSPAVPEARAKLLADRREQFRSMPAYDSVHIKSGDGGGDESEAARPYGRHFIELCRDYAQLLHEVHPETAVYVGNQKLDNAGDQAILQYLQDNPADWCAGLCYGPGSNAMGWTPGRRQDHRMDLFRYARRGGMSRYLSYLLHELPPKKDILLFTDLTHWVYSQYGLMDHAIIADRDHQTPPAWDGWMYARRPDAALAQVYDRRTFHARPRNYYRVFQETTPYVIGDVAYSEGHHDHLNQWIYQRLFWDPHQSVEAVVREYATTHFGREAARAMTEAIFTLEENLQTPILGNRGIDHLIELVEQAGEAMPESLRQENYLWHLYAEKAYLDKAIQLDLRQQEAFVADIYERLRNALKSDAPSEVLDQLGHVARPSHSDEIEQLKRLAARHGERAEQIYGVRSEGLFALEQDYIGFGWLEAAVERARQAETLDETHQRLEEILDYEDPGDRGFYDNAGVPGGAPRLVHGWTFGDGIFDPSNRPSQRTMAFTTDEERGVSFRYQGLDPAASYRVRLTLVRPRYLPRFGKFQKQTSQSIYADDLLLADELELPEYRAKQFEYEIPREATADGELLLWMKKTPGVGEGTPGDTAVWRNTGGWGTLVSEVWLMKDER